MWGLSSRNLVSRGEDRPVRRLGRRSAREVFAGLFSAIGGGRLAWEEVIVSDRGLNTVGRGRSKEGVLTVGIGRAKGLG